MAYVDLGKVKLTYNGKYDSDTTYEMLSIVESDWKVKYLSIKDDNKGKELTDTEYWTPLTGEWVEQYQGALDEEPNERLDGSDLQEGDLYFDTTIKKIKIYKGDGKWYEPIEKTETLEIIGDNLESVNSDTDAVKGKRYLSDTSDGSFTFTLIDDPEENDKIFIWDVKGTFNDNPVTLNRNGKTINGLDEDLDLDIDNRLYICEYIGNDDWRVY